MTGHSVAWAVVCRSADGQWAVAQTGCLRYGARLTFVPGLSRQFPRRSACPVTSRLTKDSKRASLKAWQAHRFRQSQTLRPVAANRGGAGLRRGRERAPGRTPGTGAAPCRRGGCQPGHDTDGRPCARRPAAGASRFVLEPATSVDGRELPAAAAAGGHQLAVFSAHLPLDVHPKLGNNARLCAALD